MDVGSCLLSVADCLVRYVAVIVYNVKVTVDDVIVTEGDAKLSTDFGVMKVVDNDVIVVMVMSA